MSSAKWHFKALAINEENQIPLLGLFKERQDGAGHSFGNTAVREYINMTQEPVSYADQAELAMDKTNQFASEDIAYKDKGYEKRSPEQIDEFDITPSYQAFIDNLYQERSARPAALRDILLLPLDFSKANTVEAFSHLLDRFHLDGNVNYLWGGISIESVSRQDRVFTFCLDNTDNLSTFAEAMQTCWADHVEQLSLHQDKVDVVLAPKYAEFIGKIQKRNRL